MDVGKPIMSGLFLKRDGLKPAWVSFKYEKLPIVCYKCGRLAHDTKSCKIIINKKEQSYGSRLRAEDPSQNIPIWTDSATVKVITC